MLKVWSVPPSWTSASKRDGVVALHQAVHELVHVDGLTRVDAVVERVAFRELLHREVRGQVDDVAE